MSRILDDALLGISMIQEACNPESENGEDDYGKKAYQELAESFSAKRLQNEIRSVVETLKSHSEAMRGCQPSEFIEGQLVAYQDIICILESVCDTETMREKNESSA